MGIFVRFYHNSPKNSRPLQTICWGGRPRLQHGETALLVLPEGSRQGVNVLPGGLRAEADPDGPGGDLLGQAHGGEDMAGLPLVAGGTGGFVGGKPG